MTTSLADAATPWTRGTRETCAGDAFIIVIRGAQNERDPPQASDRFDGMASTTT